MICQRRFVRTYIEPFEFEGSDIDLAFHFGSDAWPAAVCHRLMGEVAAPAHLLPVTLLRDWLLEAVSASPDPAESSV